MGSDPAPAMQWQLDKLVSAQLAITVHTDWRPPVPHFDPALATRYTSATNVLPANNQDGIPETHLLMAAIQPLPRAQREHSRQEHPRKGQFSAPSPPEPPY